MNITATSILGAALTVAALANGAIVGSIPVLNPSFESPATATFDYTVTDWLEENKTANDSLEAVQNENANTNLPKTDYGLNWVNLADTAAVYQELDTYAHDWSYTFSDLVIGDRSNKLFGSLRVEIWVGNGTGAHNTALSSFATLADFESFDITETGSPVTVTLGAFTLDTGHSFTPGDKVWLRLASVDGGGAAGDSQVLVDNLSITAIPEPTQLGWVMLGLAAAVVSLRRRRDGLN